ncbi:MAG: hypothetical protein IPK31_17135 [Chitinophagaceae bacterium]|nr:hypothetical protein [Chitinophagaceae bacterium]
MLEDFHKISEEEKIMASQMMKIFMDSSFEFPELKIVALGAVGTGREVVEYDEEMNDRVTEIFVRLMKNAEITSIINKGEELLNIQFAKEVKSKIVRFSSGLASVCHQLCLNMCFAKEINYTQTRCITLTMENLDKAIQKYLIQKADSFKAQFDKSIRIQHSSSFNLPKEILKVAIEIKQDEFTFSQIYQPLKTSFKAIPEDLVKKLLEEFQTVKRSEILFMDSNSNKYYFSSHFTKAYIKLRIAEERRRVAETISYRQLEEKRLDQLLYLVEKEIQEEIRNAEEKYSSFPETLDPLDELEIPKPIEEELKKDESKKGNN